MTLRRRHPVSDAAARAASLLEHGERQVALLDRVRPLNLDVERARLSAHVDTEPQPRFEYGARPRLGELRRVLDSLVAALLEGDSELRLLAARASELSLEAELAEGVATRAFPALAARRFPAPARAGALCGAAREAVALTAPDEAGETHLSDDQRDPNSLWSQLVSRAARKRLPVRVEVASGLVPLAAVGDGVVRLRPGARLTAAVGRRVALHELDGHVVPRLAGRALGGVLLAGSAGAAEDEEGRAIWLEHRAGLLSVPRRRELGFRFLASAAVREGADFWQTVRLLLELGCGRDAAVELSCRVHRGGGLGRELVYWSGFSRVSASFRDRPELERALASGRLSVEVAAQLLDEGSLQLDDDGDVV